MVDPHGIESARTDDMAAMWRAVLRRSVSYLEQGIAAAVVVLLTLAVLLVLWNVAAELVRGFRGGLGEHGLTNLLSQALLALMIAEIIASVGAFFERRGLDAGPLLVIGIIASVRRLLVISAEAANFLTEGTEVPVSMLVELGILTVSIGIFAWSIRQVHGTRQDG